MSLTSACARTSRHVSCSYILQTDGYTPAHECCVGGYLHITCLLVAYICESLHIRIRMCMSTNALVHAQRKGKDSGSTVGRLAAAEQADPKTRDS